MDDDFEVRLARFAALGDRVRLRIVDELARSDRSPGELARRTGVGTNLLAHHLDVLEHAGLIARTASTGDARRKYVRLRHDVAGALVASSPAVRRQRALFVCTENAARSQLAAGLWTAMTGARARSAGTRPAAHVHPGAIAAAARAGVDLGGATPTGLDRVRAVPPLVVTVCDRAHEELGDAAGWLHWSLPDPAARGTAAAFDATVRELRERIATLTAVA